jgi:aspartate 1-decarboxylase
MQRIMFKSKIHRAVVTDADLNYIGSVVIDEALMEKADIVENEKLLIVNLTNGARYETYAIRGNRGSGIISLNGGGARLGLKGDLLIIISFGMYDEKELKDFKPTVVHVDENNKIFHIDQKKGTPLPV